MSEFATWPPRDAPVSPATLAREMMALTQASLSPPPFPADAAGGDGQPVIVIPGFLAPDMSTARLREFLSGQNFLPYSWTGGVNLGPMRHVMREVERQVRDLADKTGRPISLVGVSLGGTIARQAAKCCPGQIARVITLVSPIHPPITTPLAPLAQAAALLWDAEELKNLAAISEPPPVPLTAIVSRDDGIIDWRASIPAPSDRVEVVEISGTHMAICSNPQVQGIVADRLARG
ncbi:MAG TPA: YqiA/YcfP family alpha/beta fold hydrolase [Rhizomicrobium sp.]|nr:YqiA/YcfP family alpha/beta fold hydrolase [Rhizomicrobium sp.]